MARIILNAPHVHRALGASPVSELVQKHFCRARGWGSQFGQYFVGNLIGKLGDARHAFARATMPTSAAMRPSGGGGVQAPDAASRLTLYRRNTLALLTNSLQ